MGEPKTYFHEVFKKYNQIHNVAKMAKSISIDRTVLQKIITGDRKFPDEASLCKLTQELTLSASATEELLQAFRIDKIGLSNYNRRNIVRQLIESPGKYSNNISFSAKTTVDYDFSTLPPVSAISGINNVKSVLRVAVASEQALDNAHLRIIAPPSVSCMHELIPTMVSSTPELKMTHIFAMLTLPNDNDENTYNLSCINDIFDLFYTGCSYTPMVYYVNELTRHDFLPCMLLTHNSVVQFSQDLSQAIVTLSPEVINLQKQFFEDRLKSCFALTTPLLDGDAFFEMYSAFDRGIFQINYISSAPCFGLFLYEELLEDVACDFVPNRKALIDHCVLRNKKLTSLIDPLNYVAYFTEEGLDAFIRTGRVPEIPEAFYKPLNDEQKYNLLSSIYETISKEDNTSAVVNPAKFHIPTNFEITVYNAKDIAFVLHVKNDYLALNLHETSIAYAIRDFLDNIHSTEYLLSKEESLNILGKKLAQLKP